MLVSAPIDSSCSTCLLKYDIHELEENWAMEKEQQAKRTEALRKEIAKTHEKMWENERTLQDDMQFEADRRIREVALEEAKRWREDWKKSDKKKPCLSRNN